MNTYKIESISGFTWYIVWYAVLTEEEYEDTLASSFKVTQI